MAISQQDLRNAAQRGRKNYARLPGQRTAFLSHSHKDDILALGLQTLLKESGLDIYIDWQDTTMPETPTGETAEKLRKRIVSADLFLFLATENSMASRWCPWEIGYADGKKPLDTIMVISTHDTSGRYYGSEYLQLYRRIDGSSAGSLAAYQPFATSGTFVRFI